LFLWTTIGSWNEREHAAAGLRAGRRDHRRTPGDRLGIERERDADDIRDAIRACAALISTSLPDLPVIADWQVNQVEASFGITLAAEAGVILSKG